MGGRCSNSDVAFGIAASLVRLDLVPPSCVWRNVRTVWGGKVALSSSACVLHDVPRALRVELALPGAPSIGCRALARYWELA